MKKTTESDIQGALNFRHFAGNSSGCLRRLSQGEFHDPARQNTKRRRGIPCQRQGTVALLLLILMVPLVGLLAFFVDYGYLLYVKTELQRSADQAVLAAVQDLTPDAFGNQDLQKARDTVKSYLKFNMGDGFVVSDSDIEIGRYNPATIYTTQDLLNDGTMDTVRVVVRQDDTANQSISLFFARLFDRNKSGVIATSTAVLQRGRYIGPGAKVFPFTIEQKSWNHLAQGEILNIYGSGKIEDESGHGVPGNWGTLDIGDESNSQSSLSSQIRNGLTQNDLDELYQDNRIPDVSEIDAGMTINLNGDTGLSAGLRHAIEDVQGQMKIIPIYKKLTGGGGNLEYEIVQWATVEVVGSSWNGSKNTRIEIRKSYTYDKSLRPVSDLSDQANVIEGAYTSPALIQ